MVRSALALALSICLAACSQSKSAPTTGSKEDRVANIASSDERMNEAISQARDTLPAFWNHFSNPGDRDNFMLKVRFKGIHTAYEHIWLTGIRRNGAEITGVVNNDPEDVPSIKLDQRVVVNPADISDWSYRRGGKYFGFFTLRVLIAMRNPDALTQQSILSPTPLESGGA